MNAGYAEQQFCGKFSALVISDFYHNFISCVKICEKKTTEKNYSQFRFTDYVQDTEVLCNV